MKGRDGKMYVVKGGRWVKVVSKNRNPKGELLDDYKPTLSTIDEDKPYQNPSFYKHVFIPVRGRSLLDKYMDMQGKRIRDDVIIETIRRDARNYSQEDDVEDMIAPVIADLDL